MCERKRLGVVFRRLDVDWKQVGVMTVMWRFSVGWTRVGVVW